MPARSQPGNGNTIIVCEGDDVALRGMPAGISCGRRAVNIVHGDIAHGADRRSQADPHASVTSERGLRPSARRAECRSARELRVWTADDSTNRARLRRGFVVDDHHFVRLSSRCCSERGADTTCEQVGAAVRRDDHRNERRHDRRHPLLEQEWADRECVERRCRSTSKAPPGRAYDRFTARVEGCVDEDGHAAALIECAEKDVRTTDCRATDRLYTCGAVHMAHGRGSARRARTHMVR